MQQHRSGRNACRRDRARRGRRGARRQLSKYLFDEKTGVFSVITMSRPQVKVARFAAGSPLAEGYQGVLHDVPDGTFMGGGSAPGDGMRLRFRVPRDEITRFATALGGAAQVVGDGLADRKEGGEGELECAADQRWGWISPVEVAGFGEWIPRSATPEGVVVVLREASQHLAWYSELLSVGAKGDDGAWRRAPPSFWLFHPRAAEMCRLVQHGRLPRFRNEDGELRDEDDEPVIDSQTLFPGGLHPLLEQFSASQTMALAAQEKEEKQQLKGEKAKEKAKEKANEKEQEGAKEKAGVKRRRGAGAGAGAGDGDGDAHGGGVSGGGGAGRSSKHQRAQVEVGGGGERKRKRGVPEPASPPTGGAGSTYTSGPKGKGKCARR